MVKMIVRHKVANYNEWKPVYDKHGAVRKEYGCKNETVFSNVQDPNDVLVVLQWESQEDAIKFGQSASLQTEEARAGVIGTPEVSFAA